MLIEATGRIASQVSDAIRAGARATGVDFEYLLKTAQRESSFNPAAKATTSSATGLFQFIEQTWLHTLKTAGPALGLADAAAAIERTESGRYVVADPAQRRQIMDLRKDPAAASAMAGAFTRSNAQYLRGRLGREPNDGELYIAHFLGAGGAAKLISSAENNPQASAADLFPGAARANRSIFYRGGAARTAGQVYNVLIAKHMTTPTPRLRPDAPADAPAAATAVAAAVPSSSAPRALQEQVAALLPQTPPAPPAPGRLGLWTQIDAAPPTAPMGGTMPTTGRERPSMQAPLTPAAMVAARWPAMAPARLPGATPANGPAPANGQDHAPEAPAPVAPAPLDAEPGRAIAFAGEAAPATTPAAAAAGSVFHGLFRTADAAPVSSFISELWGARSVHDPDRIGAGARGAEPEAANAARREPAGPPLELHQFLRPDPARRGRRAA